MKKFSVLLSGILTVTWLSAQKKIDFQTDPATGVQYHFVKHAKTGAKVSDTMFAKVVMKYTDPKDSVLFDTHVKGGDSTGTLMQGIPLKKTFNGCLEQALSMMHAGDSAIFRINADSLYLKTFHAPAEKVPAFITSTTFYTFYIKLTQFESKQQLMDDRQRVMQDVQRKMQQRRLKEPTDIASYLAKNHPEAKPDADSLFILSKTNGAGKQVMDGDSIEMAYKGYLFDGTVFDQSHPGEGLKFVYTKTVPLIKGWVALLPTMREGDKITVLIPSSRAYGANGAGGAIQPYTPLIFDMELMHAVTPKK